MNKKISKILTTASVVVMPLASAVPAFAQTEKEENATNEKTAEVVINGFDKEKEDSKIAVTAYRVVKPTYKGNNVIGFEAVGGLTFKNLNGDEKGDVQVSNDEIQAAAKAILADASKFEKPTDLHFDKATGVATGNLAPGMYIVLVTGSGATVYNPVLLSVNIKDANGGIPDVSTSLDIATATKAFIKKSTPTLDKKITDKDGTDLGRDGDVVKYGDKVYFEIDTQLPSYKVAENGTAHKDAQFQIVDKLDEGFDLVDLNNVKVYLGDSTTALTKDTDYEIVQEGQGFKITFKGKTLIDNGGKDVKVKYGTKLNEKAKVDLEANVNDAKIVYTRNPSEEPKDGEEDKTFHYTFTLDGCFDKVNDAGDNLKDAEFTMYEDAECTKVLKIDGTDAVAKTDEKGNFKFKGLSTGTFYLKETKAPDGYALNDTTFKVVIEADFKDSGVLKDYKITVGDKDDAKTNRNVVDVAAQFDDNGNKTGDQTLTPYEIKNIKISKMPSTGGAGTLLFTAGGATLFLSSAAAFLKAKKARKENN